MLKLYNSYSNSLEEVLLSKDKVKVYLCGPTVQSSPHIGHGRSAVVFDFFIRYLKYLDFNISFVRNITDIEDKIILKSAEQNIDFKELAENVTKEFKDAYSNLNCIPPDVEPKATEYIPEMIELIEDLISKGHAYEKDGHVLFHVPSYENYGKLSKRNRDEQIAGSRVEIAPFKRDPADFVLWKPSNDIQPGWNSPWGFGRPGWHTECSAMSEKTLGLPFDIHGGGRDLTFPHHENEIAQSEGANDCTFVNTWMHVGFVNINDEKMSKSLNNFFTIRGVLENYDGETLRYFIMSSHYRSPLNFSDANLNNAKSSLTRLYTAIRDLHASDAALDEVSQRFDFETRFNEALDDDFNTPIALSILFELAKLINLERNKDLDQASALAQLLIKLGSYIGLLQMEAELFLKQGVALSDEDIDKKIRLRDEARDNKNFAMSDQIRDELAALGIVLEDGENGTSWRRE